MSGGFEAHQTTYCVNLSQWSVRLASLLCAEVLVVLQYMKKEDQGDYFKVREKLFKYFHVSQMIYSHVIDELERKPGERWVACAQRILGLVKRWCSHCETVEEVCELLAFDKLLKIMPRQIAVKVKEKRPGLDWQNEVIPNKD